MHALHLNRRRCQAAIGYFNEGKQPRFDARPGAAAAARSDRAAIRSWRNFFVEIQLQAALAGDGLSELPRARLQRVALLLGLSAGDFARLESLLRFRQSGGAGRRRRPAAVRRPAAPAPRQHRRGADCAGLQRAGGDAGR